MDLNQAHGFTVGPVVFHSLFVVESWLLWTHIDHTQAGLAETAWYTDVLKWEKKD